jgi:hypothetical protein
VSKQQHLEHLTSRSSMSKPPPGTTASPPHAGARPWPTPSLHQIRPHSPGSAAPADVAQENNTVELAGRAARTTPRPGITTGKPAKTSTRSGRALICHARHTLAFDKPQKPPRRSPPPPSAGPGARLPPWHPLSYRQCPTRAGFHHRASTRSLPTSFGDEARRHRGRGQRRQGDDGGRL